MISKKQLDNLKEGFDQLGKLSAEFIAGDEEERRRLVPIIKQGEVACSTVVRALFDDLYEAASLGIKYCEEAKKPPPAGAPHTSYEGFRAAAAVAASALHAAEHSKERHGGECKEDTEAAHACGAASGLMTLMERFHQIEENPFNIDEAIDMARAARTSGSTMSN